MFFGFAKGRFGLRSWAVVHAYVAYGSNLKFEVAPNAILILDIFDDSPVRINNKSDKARNRLTSGDTASRHSKATYESSARNGSHKGLPPPLPSS